MKRTLDGIRVLVIEDDADGLEMLAEYLKCEGAIVATARNAVEARERLAVVPLDLLMSDITLPDEDGYELLAFVRGNPATSALPAIALTGHTGGEALTRARNAGFDRHVAKPIDLSELESAILALVRGDPEPQP